MNIMYEGITNHFIPGKKRPKFDCESQFVFYPNDDWNYAHHPFIAHFKGKYYVTFSSGHCHEDDVGQLMRYAYSEDFHEWSKPEILAGPYVSEHREGVVLPAGLYTDGNILTAYYMVHEWDEEVLKDGHRTNGNKGRKNFATYCISSIDGKTWSEPKLLPFAGGNTNPQTLASGRLLWPGSRVHAYTDQTDGINGWKETACLSKSYFENFDLDNGEELGTETPVGLVSDTRVSLCEGSFIQAADGVIYMLLRSGTPFLWACESHDDGLTWSLPAPTNFTDNRTKFILGRLPNGRYYYIGTPDPFPPRTRHLLALSTSNDGLVYDRHFILADAQYKGQYPGIDKNGVYGYPSAVVWDGYLCVAFSINKEKIMVLRIPCDTL